MTQLVIPMAGLGSRFKMAGYQVLKPLLPIGEFKMFEIVISNLWHESISRIVIVSSLGSIPESNLLSISRALGVSVHNIAIDYTTEGPAVTVSLAQEFLSKTDPLVIANSDQYISGDLSEFYEAISRNPRNHQILTMEDSDPRWSYAELDSFGHVTRVREKEVISKFATVGVYGFAASQDFFTALSRMRLAEDRTNGEFYVAPAYNYIDSDKKVEAVNLGPLGKVMFGLGIPEDYENFLAGGPVAECLTRARLVFGDLHAAQS